VNTPRVAHSFILFIHVLHVQGFLVNRVLIPMINEAFFCLMEVRVTPCY
jgi:3-hydroxyacyl-CoA dehydrogenase